MRTCIAALCMVVLLPAAMDAQPPGRAARGGPPAQNRAQLERQIVQRFSLQMQRNLGLSPDVHARLEQTLLDMVARERGRALEAATLQERLAVAVQDPATSDAEFEQILAGIRALREREHEEWLREMQALSTTLTPRQRAQVMLGLARLQQRIRNMIDNRAGRGGRGG